MALSQELKELKRLARTLGYSSRREEVDRAVAYLSSKGWTSSSLSESLISTSRWRYHNKGPWVSIRTALNRQIEKDHTWGFSKEEIHEIALDIQRACEDRWNATELQRLTDRLVNLTEPKC